MLSTPLSVKEVLRGQLLALRRLFLGPLLAVIAIEIIFLAASLQRESFHQNPINPVLWAAAIFLRGTFYFWELLVISASVQIGLVLPMALYFHRVSFSGLSANMVVVPLLSLAVPAGAH